MARLIPAKGRIRNEYPVMPDFGRRDFTIEQLQKLVGETFQVIPLRHIDIKLFCVANLQGFEDNLPLNVAGSMQARTALYGDVLIVRFEELGGEV